MLKAEQVPDEVWMTMQSVIGDHVSVSVQKEAIAAAINAWPGMSTGPNIYGRRDAVMRLPLPQEKQNG